MQSNELKLCISIGGIAVDRCVWLDHIISRYNPPNLLQLQTHLLKEKTSQTEARWRPHNSFPCGCKCALPQPPACAVLLIPLSLTQSETVLCSQVFNRDLAAVAQQTPQSAMNATANSVLVAAKWRRKVYQQQKRVQALMAVKEDGYLLVDNLLSEYERGCCYITVVLSYSAACYVFQRAGPWEEL